MLPTTLALVDDDVEYAGFLAQHLRELGIDVTSFRNGNDLISDIDPYRFEFYVVDLMLPGIDGVALTQMLRRRTDAGLLVVSGRLGAEVFAQVVGAGADMYVAKPVQLEHVALAVRALYRRSSDRRSALPWKLDRRARQLIAPDGGRADLTHADLSLIECFVAANGEAVPRSELLGKLTNVPGTDNKIDLNATIYRLRRRIERSTPAQIPLQPKSGIGYVFHAPLKAI